MININVKPVFTSRKLSQTLSVKENKPPFVNTQCVVYSFQCDLCDANYVGLTTRPVARIFAGGGGGGRGCVLAAPARNVENFEKMGYLRPHFVRFEYSVRKQAI